MATTTTIARLSGHDDAGGILLTKVMKQSGCLVDHTLCERITG
jgi:hypothetical protein